MAEEKSAPPGRTTRPAGQRGIGWAALVGFLAVCVVLIVMIWVDNLTPDGEEATPGYYRDTFQVDESVYATVTAEAAAAEAPATPQPTATVP